MAKYLKRDKRGRFAKGNAGGPGRGHKGKRTRATKRDFAKTYAKTAGVAALYLAPVVIPAIAGRRRRR